MARRVRTRFGRRSRGDGDLRRVDRTMEWLAIALLPIGLTAILLGYLGVARHGLVFLQLPYLVSGGLLGVGLLFASGTIYLASWISRTSAVQRQQQADLLEAVNRLSRQLAVVSVPEGGRGRGNGVAGTFVATPSGSMFHRPDCAIVAEREDVRTVRPDVEDMQPCGMCDPLGAGSSPVGAN